VIVSLTERLFGRSSSGAKLDLAPVMEKLAQSVRASSAPDIELSRARLADHCRNAGLLPILPEEFDRAAANLDAEGQRRLAVLVSLFEVEGVRTVIAQQAATWPVYQLVNAAFTGLAEDTSLLTIEVLGQSEQRVEELARRFLAAIRASINGETAEDSKKRLHKLDYARLLAEADKARTAAAERAERLRQLQEQQEQRRGRRGKW
jgi:hypothetical protein